MKAGVKSRIFWIDCIKALAIMLVVLVHATEQTYHFIDIEWMSQLRLRTQIFSYGLFTMGRMGVPLFLFASGYLLLGRNYDAENTKKFWRKKLLGLLITTEIWLIFYVVFKYLHEDAEISVGILVQNLLLMRTSGMQMWYMPMILGIYLFLPFVGVALQNTDTRLLKIPLLVTVAYLFVIPVANVVLTCMGAKTIWGEVDLSFSGGLYGSLVVAGYICREKAFLKIKNPWILVCGGVGAFLLTVWLQVYALRNGTLYNVWYNNIFLIVAAFCIFEFASRCENWNVSDGTGSQDRRRRTGFQHVAVSFVSSVSRCSFGMYLLHGAVLPLLMQVIHMQNRPPQVFTLSCLTFLISWGIVWLVGHWPKAAKVLFYYH